MLFQQLPVLVLGVILAICCAVKHLAVTRMANTRWCQVALKGRRWRQAALFLAIWGAALTLFLFSRFVQLEWAIAIAVADVFYYGICLHIANRVRLFELDHPRYLKIVVLMRSCHGLMYVLCIYAGLTHGR